jgi:hypothetical protein
MHSWLLYTHSLLRWLVIAVAVLALLRGSARRGGPLARAFAVTLDVQVVLGLWLYWLSPITNSALMNMGGAMQNRVVRFWAVEHATTMLVALVLAHIGVARGRKGKVGAAVLIALALLAVLVATPWPGLPYGRPLLPSP